MDPLYVLKGTLSTNLEKIGHSLEDLEEALEKGAYDEAHEMLCKSADLIPPTMFGAAASGLGNMASSSVAPYLTLSGGAGLVGGMLADKLEGHVEGRNKDLGEYQKQLKMLQKQIQQLEFENAYH